MDSTVNVSLVMGMLDPKGNPTDRFVGLVLTPEQDFILGAIPNTPAEKLVLADRDAVAEAVGIPWHPNPASVHNVGLTFTQGTSWPTNINAIDGEHRIAPPLNRRQRRNRRRK